MSAAGLAFNEEDELDIEDLFMEFVEEVSLVVGFMFDCVVLLEEGSLTVVTAGLEFSTQPIGGWTGGAFAGTGIVSDNNASIACNDDTK